MFDVERISGPLARMCKMERDPAESYGRLVKGKRRLPGVRGAQVIQRQHVYF